MDQLARAFSALEEDRVYQIVDKRLKETNDPLSIVDELSKGMETMGEYFSRIKGYNYEKFTLPH